MSIKAWILSVASTSIILSILSLIIPSNKLNKNVLGVFSLIMVVVIIQPIINFSIDGELDFSNGNSEVNYQQDYLDYMYMKRVENNKILCQNFLKEKDIENAEISVLYFVDDNYNLQYEKVYINLKNSGINWDKEHIDIINEIQNFTKSLFNLNEKDVEIEK